MAKQISLESHNILLHAKVVILIGQNYLISLKKKMFLHVCLKDIRFLLSLMFKNIAQKSLAFHAGGNRNTAALA